MNLSIKALFCWVKAATGSGEETDIEDLQNGEILLKLVHLFKKSIPSSCQCADERFKIISNFITSDCRFNALNGTPIEWEAIKEGRNFSVEIAKVILILVYYDMMNDHCTLEKLDCDVERQIAGLTLTYVEENEGSVSLVPGLDAHLSKKHLTVSHNILEKSASVSTTTSVSSLSSLYDDDDESPLFGRSQKVKFLDLQKVASSSVSSSPIQDVMNTPVFQMRRMQRQLIQDRDYIDGLEKELSNKLALLSQRESQINQLQYCLDKLKEDRGADEQSTRAHIDELENKKNMLQSCLDDYLKQNKELKNNAALTERKVNELAEENGVLTSQMRTACSRLAISEAEVGKLTEAHESNEAEWQNGITTLQSELCEARAQKELYAEQIEILQGKISCLKDEIDRSTQEEGENMWISVEKQLLESRICTLTEELENVTNSLEKIEAEVQAKTQQLKAYEHEISDQKELLIQQQNQIDQLLESKNEAIDKLQKEMAEMGETLQQEIQALKLRLEEAEKQKQQQATRLQVQVVSCNEEIEKLKEIKHQKEELLLQTVERADDLMTKLCSANTLLSDRDQEVSGLKETVHLLTEAHQQTKNESQANEAMFSQLLQEKSQEAEALKSLIDSLKDEVNILKSSLERAEEEMQIKATLLSETRRESDEQMEALQRDIDLCKETIETLKMEIRMKDEEITEAKRDNLMQCEKQQQEKCALKAQIGILGESLNDAKEQAQNCQTEAEKQKEESCQNEAILREQLSSSEEMVKTLKEEINTKTDQLAMLENQSVDQSANITDLQQQVASLRAQLVKAEEDVQIKENHFALKQDQVEGLLAQVSQFEDEIKSMQGNLQRKEEELLNLKRETSKHEEQLKEDYLKRSEELDNEISRLTLQVKSLHESLNSTAEQLTVKEDLLARKETELSQEKDAAQKRQATFDDEMIVLQQQLQAKEREMITLKDESDDQSNLQQQEIQIMKSQLDDMAETLRNSEEGKLQILSEQQKRAREQELLQEQLSQCQIVVKQLENEFSAKEREMAVNSEQSQALCSQNEDLQKRLESLTSSLNDAKQQAQNCQAEAEKQKEESCQNEAILREQLSSSEEMVKRLKEEINTKTDQLAMLENQSVDQLANKTDLQQQVASLRAQLVKAEEDVQIKENHFALKQDQVEGLLAQVSQFEDEIKSMQGNLQRKEEELLNLKRETSKHEEQLKEDYLKRSEELDKEISRLTLQVKSLHESLNSTAEQLTVKEDLLARKETELSQEKDAAQKLQATFDEEMIVLQKQLQAKEREMITLKDESVDQSNLQQQEIQIMKSQLDDMAETLRNSEEGKLQILSEQQKSAQEQESLQEQLSQCQIVVKQLENEFSAKEREMAVNSEQSQALCSQNEDLQKRLESLASSLEDAQEKMHSKELLLIQHQQEAKQKQEDLMLKVEQAEKETLELKVKSGQSQVDLLLKEELLLQTQEQHQIVQAELSAFKIKMTENDNYVVKLKEAAVAQIEVIRQTKEQLKSKESALIELQEQSSRQIGDLQQCVESLKSLFEDRSQNAAAKDEQFRGLQLESVQQIQDLTQELVSVAAELKRQKEINIHILSQKDETIESTQMERDSLIKEKAALDARVLAVDQQLEGAVLENKRLSQAKQAFERENYAALKLQAKLQEELQALKRDNTILLNEKEKIKDVEEKDLLQQLTAKTTAMEHYKAQMEKAMDHYNSKKELLKKSEGEVANLKHALEVQASELKNVTLEKKLVQMELDRIQSNEKILLNKIASLEAQQSFADKALREQNTLMYDHNAQRRRASTLEVAGDRYGVKSRSKPQSISSDSLDQSSLDDSLNDTRKLSAPESSTPLVRSSERLAAKRHVLQAESLETLYFTPINTRYRSTKPEESAKRHSASSVKRRRTTQKTPGRNEADETFYSLASARSQPNLSSAHKVSTELFNTPKAAESDQLIGLPGYRRSTIHSQATSTFCVGAENEPDGGPEDWMRIAEIQARNKACLPHLKSSYPLEFDSVRNSALTFTDEELRTGDPIETIRRASVMPGQLQDSLASHRLSYMGQRGNMAPSLSRLSTMPGQVNSTLRSPKGSKRAASTLSLHTTSPEKKTRASCFPRPLTPKNRNVSGPAFPHGQTAPSPADRRQSMMFTIDNTPKKDSRKDVLKKGLNKLRNSTRKSPGKSLKSPAQSASRRGQENVPTKAGRPAVGGAGRLGNQKSPQVANKGQRKSPRGPQRAAKSPGITASARKMMSRMKV